MVREITRITGRIFKVDTYNGTIILEIDDFYDEDVRDIRTSLKLECCGCKFNLFVWLAQATLKGYIIQSVSEFNRDGTRPKVAYAANKDFKKILKYLKEKQEEETEKQESEN